MIEVALQKLMFMVAKISVWNVYFKISKDLYATCTISLRDV